MVTHRQDHISRLLVYADDVNKFWILNGHKSSEAQKPDSIGQCGRISIRRILSG
jgi:hypothetical protein